MAPELSNSVSDRSVPVSSGSVNSGARSPALSILFSLLRLYPSLAWNCLGAILWQNEALLLVFFALFGGVAQLGERRVRNAKVEGSIPFSSTIQRGRISISGLSFLPR